MTAPPDSSAGDSEQVPGTPGAARRPRGRRLIRRTPARRPVGPRSAARRRLGTAARLVAALTLVGWLYTAFAPGAQAQDDPQALSAAAAEGKQLFDTSCVSCHGPNAEGATGRGPSLIGVGSAAVEFQVGTGRMPMVRQEAQAQAKPPVFTDTQISQLAQYIQEIGGGPQIPEGTDLANKGDEALAAGGELFRLNCSSCHAFSANGGALSSGKFAPPVRKATDRQIYAAMLTGPQNMPVFGDNQLTPEEKGDIIAYIRSLDKNEDLGGWGMSGYGPVPEGIAIFLVGVVVLLFTTLWIAGKS